VRGRKPDLRVIAGPGEANAGDPTPNAGGKGNLACPPYITGKQKAAWNRFIAPAYWLTENDEIKAALLCELFVEWQESRSGMPASRISVMRNLSTDLLETAKRIRPAAPARRSRMYGYGHKQNS
jgi:hypothetical protein